MRPTEDAGTADILTACMPESATSQLVQPPLALTRLVVGALGLVALLSALGVGGMALVQGAQPYWLLVGMEVCIVLAGVFAGLFFRGKCSDGPALAILCIAGTVFAAGFLSWLSVRGGMTLKGDRTVSLQFVMLARVAIAAALVALASFEVLRRNTRSRGFLLRAVATGVPLAIVAGSMYAGRQALATQQAVPAWIVWTVVSIAVVVAMGLLCACGHFLIRAFEMGRPEHAGAQPAEAPPISSPPGATSS